MQHCLQGSSQSNVAWTLSSCTLSNVGLMLIYISLRTVALVHVVGASWI